MCPRYDPREFVAGRERVRYTKGPIPERNGALCVVKFPLRLLIEFLQQLQELAFLERDGIADDIDHIL